MNYNKYGVDEYIKSFQAKYESGQNELIKSILHNPSTSSSWVKGLVVNYNVINININIDKIKYHLDNIKTLKTLSPTLIYISENGEDKYTIVNTIAKKINELVSKYELF